jgi:hypothetical protein
MARVIIIFGAPGIGRRVRPETIDHRIHEIGNDVRVVELNSGEEARIARNIGDDEVGRFRLRKHCNLSQNRRNSLLRRPPERLILQLLISLFHIFRDERVKFFAAFARDRLPNGWRQSARSHVTACFNIKSKHFAVVSIE